MGNENKQKNKYIQHLPFRRSRRHLLDEYGPVLPCCVLDALLHNVRGELVLREDAHLALHRRDDLALVLLKTKA